MTCTGPATRCKAGVKLDGILSKLPKERQRFKTTVRVVGKGKKRRRVVTRVKVPLTQPKLVVKLRSPQGRLTRKTFKLSGLRSARRRLKDLEVRVPAPKLWSPDNPQLYSALGEPGLQGPHRAGRPQEDRPALGEGGARRAAG